MTDRIILACTLVLAGVYFWATAQIPSLELGDPLGPKAFPQMLGVGLLIGAAMLLAEILRGRRNPPAQPAEAVWDSGNWVVAAVAAWTAAYIASFEFLGYMLATLVYLLALTSYFNKGRHLMNVLTCVLFVAGSYFMFTKLLGVNLARGLLPV
jgi:putative tricarboxylic transport membrane protein